jgi:hypothetical protein
MRKKFLFICLSWLIALTANADNLTLYLTKYGLSADPNISASSAPYYTTDTSIEEGKVVTIRYTGNDNTTVLSIYINGEVVSSGKISLKKSFPYTFTAKKNCFIRVEGNYAFNFTTNPNVYFTQDVDVTANEGATGEYWATYYNGTTSFTTDENTTVFQAALSGNQLTMTEVANREIPAGKAVILKSSSSSITLTPAATTATLNGNQLVGTATAITNPGNAYVLSKKNGVVGFYKLSSTGTIGANKAYLTYSGAGAREFFSIEGNVTGIEMPKAATTNSDAEVYDLQGRQVANPTKGLYIVNGKKVFINK